MTASQPTIIADSIGFQPEGPDPQNIRIKLSQYVIPTFGTLAGTGHTFTIQNYDPGQSFILSRYNIVSDLSGHIYSRVIR